MFKRLFSSKTIAIATSPLNPHPRTASLVVIGSEILSSHVKDSNSYYFAKWCYQRGILLKKLTTIPDDPNMIKETVLDSVSKFDLTVTSGGIGSTHDDITYQSVASSFNLELKFDSESFDYYKKLRGVENYNRLDAQSKNSFLRMFKLPSGENVWKLYSTKKGTWTPVVCINHKLCILPGVPWVFEELVDDVIGDVVSGTVEFLRRFIVTGMKEIEFARDLECLQDELVKKGKEISLGSYPHLRKGLCSISVTGTVDDAAVVNAVVDRVIVIAKGRLVTEEEEYRIVND